MSGTGDIDLIQIGVIVGSVVAGVAAAVLGRRAGPSKNGGEQETARVYLDGPLSKIIEALNENHRRVATLIDIVRDALDEYKRRDDQHMTLLRDIKDRLGWRNRQSNNNHTSSGE